MIFIIFLWPFFRICINYFFLSFFPFLSLVFYFSFSFLGSFAIGQCLFCLGHKKCEDGAPWKLFEKCVLYRQCTLFSRLKKFPWSPLKSAFFGFIRSCQNPIGRAQPKNWNLWLCHIKQRCWKKVDRILCSGYKDWWQSYRGRSTEVWKKAVFAIEKQGMAKKTNK